MAFAAVAAGGGGGGGGVAGGCKAGDESLSPSTPPAESPDTVREIEEAIVNLRRWGEKLWTALISGDRLLSCPSPFWIGLDGEKAEAEIRDEIQKYVTGSWAFDHMVVHSSFRGNLR